MLIIQKVTKPLLREDHKEALTKKVLITFFPEKRLFSLTKENDFLAKKKCSWQSHQIFRVDSRHARGPANCEGVIIKPKIGKSVEKTSDGRHLNLIIRRPSSATTHSQLRWPTSIGRPTPLSPSSLSEMCQLPWVRVEILSFIYNWKEVLRFIKRFNILLGWHSRSMILVRKISLQENVTMFVCL